LTLLCRIARLKCGRGDLTEAEDREVGKHYKMSTAAFPRT